MIVHLYPVSFMHAPVVRTTFQFSPKIKGLSLSIFSLFPLYGKCLGGKGPPSPLLHTPLSLYPRIMLPARVDFEARPRDWRRD